MVFRGLLRVYLTSMNKRPWLTTMVSTGCICGTGDILAQQLIEHKGKNYDIRRTVKMAAMGTLFIGPGLRTWYIVLDKLIKGASTTAVIKKVVADQFLWAPVFIAAFFSVSELLDGSSFADVEQKLKTAYLPALKANYLIWPWVQLGNFYFVPLQHRIVVVNFVALFWNMYLAWAAHQDS